ncbi:MAG: EAL domain-containing response regulator [Rhodoferax sp.]
MENLKPKILAIDDTPVNLLTLGAALKDDFDLQVATSGAMGINLALQDPPDLILLDIMMPDMDGFETCRQLKAEPLLRDIPVIFVTALNELDSEVEGLVLGAADYITKPIQVETARQRIRNLIEREQLRRQVITQRDQLAYEVTIRKLAEGRLQLAAGVFASAREGIIITNLAGEIIDVNEAFTRITGYGHDEVVGQNPSFLSSGHQTTEFYQNMWGQLTSQGHWSGEIWNHRKNGDVYAEMFTITTIFDTQGEPQNYVALFSDITELKAQQRELDHIAHFDVLTGLPNRVLLADRLRQGMAQAVRRDQQLAVIFLDFDGFKRINDEHGIEAGDLFLMTVAKRVKQSIREGDTLARIGGDEFVAVLHDIDDRTSCLPLLSRLLEAAALPVQLLNVVLRVSASLGVTFYPQILDMDAEQLLRQSEQAMYQAKLAGKNRFHMFDTAQDSGMHHHHEQTKRIRKGLFSGEFSLHYQPKVNMRTGQVIGAEALIRWQHPDQGLQMPGSFLPAVENHPLAIDIGEWVIESALTQMDTWHAQGFDLPVSVNIGTRQLRHLDFVERLRDILARHPNIKASSLGLEIKETSAIDDIASVSHIVEQCTDLGVVFAIDDFGTGFSSLTHLKRLPVAIVKLDQSFVRDMLVDLEDLSVLEGVIGLARAFHREVIAEGVETIEHGIMLLRLGCEQAQGFGIARPMPAQDLPRWAAQWQPDPAWQSPG